MSRVESDTFLLMMRQSSDGSLVKSTGESKTPYESDATPKRFQTPYVRLSIVIGLMQTSQLLFRSHSFDVQEYLHVLQNDQLFIAKPFMQDVDGFSVIG